MNDLIRSSHVKVVVHQGGIWVIGEDVRVPAMDHKEVPKHGMSNVWTTMAESHITAQVMPHLPKGIANVLIGLGKCPRLRTNHPWTVII